MKDITKDFKEWANQYVDIPFMNTDSDKVIIFTVVGKPRAKQRPRLTKSGHAYTPQETINYENWVKQCFLDQCEGQRMLEDELVAELVAIYPIPKSKSKRVKEEMEQDNIRPTSKPDLDNIAKSILDALNGIAYQDDSQIVKLSVEKKYGDEPMVKVKIYERNSID